MKKQTLADSLRIPLSCAAIWLSFSATQAGAQTTTSGATPPETGPQPTPTAAELEGETDEEIVTLSPFVVEASEDADGYVAKYTLAGTRVRTDLRDTASAIQVVTAQFLSDTGATDNQTLLQYTTNTEVGGLLGNFSGTGGGFLYNEDRNLLRPSENTRVRGLNAADNTRDYFLSDVPWDSYIVDRVDLQRGPNSILFGVGSPAGIINTSINTASFKNGGNVENRFDQYGSLRWSIDGNYVVIKDQLAVRVAALSNDQKYRQEPSFQDDKRIYGAIRFQPKLFGEGNLTDIRLNYELGSIDANRPRQMPPVDAITPWFLTGGTATNPALNKAYYNRVTQNKGNAPLGDIPWLAGAAIGRQFWNDIVATYGDNNQSAPTDMRQTLPSGLNGIGTDGQRDQGIGGLPGGHAFAVASFNAYARHPNSGLVGGNYYSDRSLSDPSIFNFYNQLIDGDNKYEWSDFDVGTLGMSQTFWDNRLGADFSYYRQSYTDGQRVFLGNSDTYKIGIDMNNVLPDGTLNGGDTINNRTGAAGADGIGDNVGRAYVANSDEQANSWNARDRDAWRLTLTGELRGEDLFGESTLAKIFGKHIFTGLVSKETLETQVQNWATSAATTDFPSYLGMNTSLTAHFRSYNYVAYLSPTLMGRDSAAGSKLDRVRSTIKAPSEAVVRIFDNHWNRPTGPGSIGYVNAAASGAPTETALAGYIQAPHVLADNTIVMRWFDPAGYYAGGHSPTQAAAAYAALTPAQQANPAIVRALQPYSYLSQNAANPLTSANLNFASQSENPANYIGWTNRSVKFLNADAGDRAALTYNATKNRRVIDSQGITWQGYFFDGVVVPVYGWRKDKVVTDAGSGTPDVGTGIVPTDFGYNPAAHQMAEDTSTSYGVVVHTPRSWAEKLPGNTRFSVFLNNSENFQAGAPRGDFFGNPVPNPVGETEEYGFAVSTLDDKLTFKATWYETVVTNATLDGGGLGNNGYFFWAMPAWGTAFVANAAQGIAGNNDNNSWAWNYAATDDPNAPAFKVNGTMNPAWLSHPSTVALQNAINDWRNIPLPQSFFNAYGNEVALINVDAIRAGNWAAADPIWATKFDNQPISGGLLAGYGSAPVMTVTTESKGVEFELGAQFTKNWNLTFNFSKTFATRSQLAPEMVDLMLDMEDFFAGPAGDIRLWGSASNPLRNEWRNNVINPYNTLLAQQGSNAPELSPYTFRLVTNYAFDTETLFKGCWIGGGYRWEDGRVLGYEYDTALGNIDVDRPFKSDSESHIDLWFGRSQKLTDKINWKLQLNVRNVGESIDLKPVTINPDGSVGYSRIQEGMVWQLTNTLEF